jgi:hypothetical protein
LNATNGREGWSNLIVYDDTDVKLNITAIRRWRHDKVLCPEHARALDALLLPGTGAAELEIVCATPKGRA